MFQMCLNGKTEWAKEIVENFKIVSHLFLIYVEDCKRNGGAVLYYSMELISCLEIFIF